LPTHRIRQFKLSNNPRFVGRLRDIVGLSLDPPVHAVVLSVDEKSLIQALERTQPGLLLKRGRAGTMTPGYIRHGTTMLFAAMNVRDGAVIGRTIAARNASDFSISSRSRSRWKDDPRHCRQLHDAQDSQCRPVARTASVMDFPFHPHLGVPRSTPSRAYSRSSPNECASAALFASSPNLQEVINRFIEENNQQSKPFVWTADPDKIIAAVRPCHQMSDSIH
jgi:hypothetical protein